MEFLPSKISTYSTKGELATYAAEEVQKIIDNGNSLEVYTNIAVAMEYLEQLKNGIKSTAMGQADELCADKSSAEYNGVQVQIKSAAVRYDYKGIKCYEQAKDRVKALEKMLKAATPDTPYIDTQSGEMVTELPKIYGEDSLVIILKK